MLIFALGGGISFYEGIQHIQYPEPISAKEVEADIAAIDRAIKQKFPEVKRVFIEAE